MRPWCAPVESGQGRGGAQHAEGALESGPHLVRETTPNRAIRRETVRGRNRCRAWLSGWEATYGWIARTDSYPEGRGFKSCPRYEENPWDTYIPEGFLASWVFRAGSSGGHPPSGSCWMHWCGEVQRRCQQLVPVCLRGCVREADFDSCSAEGGVSDGDGSLVGDGDCVDYG